MPNPQSRYIGDEHSAIVEQALLNMILRGDIRILRRGVDITQSCRDQAERINAAYDAAVEPKNKVNENPAKPSAMPPRSEPKPPRVRRRATSSEGKPPYSKGRV